MTPDRRRLSQHFELLVIVAFILACRACEVLS